MKKQYTFFCVLLILFQNCKAQFNPVWDAAYQHTVSPGFSNESRKVTIDLSGNVYVLIDITSDIDPNGTLTASTWHYTSIFKYSSSGILLNSSQINVFNHYASGFNNYGGFGLETDASGNVYVGYSTYDAGNNFDINLRKYDNNLIQVWSYRFKPATADLGVDMKVTSNGGIYALVKSTSGIDVTYHLLFANSALITTTPFFSFDMNVDFLNKLTLDATDKIYVTGYSMVGGFKTILTAKVNSVGNLVWKRIYNGGSSSRDDEGKNLVVGADGNIYVTGVSDQGAPFNNDIVVMKYHSGNGKSIWVKIFDNLNNNDSGNFIYAPDLTYVYVGSVSSNSILIDRITTAAGARVGTAVYQPVPASSFSTIEGVIIADMEISANHNFYLTGNVQATDLNSQAFNAAYLIKISNNPNSRNVLGLAYEIPVIGDFNQSVNAADLAIDDLNQNILWISDVYEDYSNHQNEVSALFAFNVPVPMKLTSDDHDLYLNAEAIIVCPSLVNDYLQINAGTKILNIEFFELTGKRIKSLEVQTQNVNVDLTDFSSGVYLVKLITTANKIITHKIIKN